MGSMVAKKKKITKNKERDVIERWYHGLNKETTHSIWAIVSLGFSVFFILAIFSKAGLLGRYTYMVLEFLFGDGLFLIPLLFVLAAVSLFASFRPNLLSSNLVGGFLILLSGLALAEILFGEKTGGYAGYFISLPFLKLVDFWATLIIFIIILLIGFLVMFNVPLSFSFLKRKPKQQKLFEDDSEGEEIEDQEEDDGEEEDEEYEQETASEDGQTTNSKQETKEEGFFKGRGTKISSLKFFGNKSFSGPPLDLLQSDKGKPSAGDIKANSNIIRRTFQNFGINVEIAEVCIGPAVTQYSIKPAEGVKLSRIVALNNDLSLALAAHPIRIEAPIPGKSLVGIEVPNRSSSVVGLKKLLEEANKKYKEIPLLLALGKNVAGRSVFSSIVKMPHLLIAGATGSGKSVSIHGLMMSLLFRHSPQELQLLLVDPKRVELNVYNDLPHLLTPVITEAKKAIMALKWATKEMERRYEALLEVGARDINSYHKKRPDDMPYIVIVIDELADIMATYPREFEASIVRLAQMSRAVGIHLVVSTQRPSVNVITGLIKANITGRIAFQVASQVDSRTILDMSGAEKLLGNGDMLFLSSDSSKPRRIQGSFVSEKEVRNVVDFLKKEYEDYDSQEVSMSGETQQTSIFDDSSLEDSGENGDDLYEEAREIVIAAGKASSSYLQRRLRVGYARAARLLDMLEERGVVGPADGSKPRDVLVEKPSEEY